MKSILVVRHGLAGEREAFAKINKNDDLRPLTAKGIKKMKRVSRYLKKLKVPADAIYSSHLVRAIQTADILKDDFKKKVFYVDELHPDTHPKKTLSFLNRQKKANVVIVGHEPHLSRFLDYCIFSQTKGRLELKKGGVCLITFAKGVKAGNAKMEWLLQPKLTDL